MFVSGIFCSPCPGLLLGRCGGTHLHVGVSSRRGGGTGASSTRANPVTAAILPSHSPCCRPRRTEARGGHNHCNHDAVLLAAAPSGAIASPTSFRCLTVSFWTWAQGGGGDRFATLALGTTKTRPGRHGGRGLCRVDCEPVEGVGHLCGFHRLAHFQDFLGTRRMRRDPPI